VRYSIIGFRAPSRKEDELNELLLGLEPSSEAASLHSFQLVGFGSFQNLYVKLRLERKSSGAIDEAGMPLRALTCATQKRL
jgi:hypothetical protein